MAAQPNQRGSVTPRTEVSFSTWFGRLLILFLTAGSLAMTAAAWWYYTTERQAMESAAARELASVSDVETNQIANWRRERLGDGRVLASSTVMAIAVRALSESVPRQADRAALLDIMGRLSREFAYTDATLVDLDGSVRIRLNERSTESAALKQHSRRLLARQSVSAKDVILSDLTRETRSGRPLMSLCVPVGDLGAFLLEIDPARFLYPYLESWPVPSRTAETLLVRREGKDGSEVVYLSKMRQEHPGPSFFHRRVATLQIPSDAVLAAGWSGRGRDYRGVAAMFAIHRIPDAPWYLIAKIDIDEVDAPLRRLGWEMAAITMLIGLANVAGVGFVWKDQKGRVLREMDAWLYAAANDTPAYLWMASPKDGISFINKPLAKFMGADGVSLGHSWTAYLHPDDAIQERVRFQEHAAAGGGYVSEFRVRRADGEYRRVISEAVPRSSDSGEFLGFAGSLIDVTEQRQAEEERRSANKVLANELMERSRREQEIHALTARLLGAQEEERTRLARELHDNLNQQIAALSMAMGNLKRQIPQEQIEAREQTNRVHRKLVELSETVRRISHELHPAVLEYSGLASALQAHCDEFGALTGIRVAVHVDGSFESVPPPVALCAYRIAQEALQNVAKHAKVGTATVALSRSDGVLRLTVSDAGVGIKARHEGSGLGLLSMRERARLVGGSVEIASKPDEGTSVTLSVPV